MSGATANTHMCLHSQREGDRGWRRSNRLTVGEQRCCNQARGQYGNRTAHSTHMSSARHVRKNRRRSAPLLLHRGLQTASPVPPESWQNYNILNKQHIPH